MPGALPKCCTVCNQPTDLSNSFWAGRSATDLISCNTCAECRLPVVPLTFEDLVDTILSKHTTPLGGVRGYDEGRAGIPRAHEHALWTQLEKDAEVATLASLLRQKQRSTPWNRIVELARDPIDVPRRYKARPIQVRCTCCNVERSFDHVFGEVRRVRLACEKTEQSKSTAHAHEECATGTGCRAVSYLASPALRTFEDEVVPALRAKLEDPTETCFDVDWFCTNCEASKIFEARRIAAAAEQRASSRRLGLQRRLLQTAVTLGVPLALEALPSIPCARGEVRATLDGHAPRIGVLMVQRELVEEALRSRCEAKPLVGAACVKDLFADAAGTIGDEMSTRAAAGGAAVDHALVVILPAAAIDEITALRTDGRADAFRQICGDTAGGCEGVAVASLDGKLPCAENVNDETRRFYESRDAEKLNSKTPDVHVFGKSESCRPGAVRSWASLIDQPDVVRYVRMKSVPGGEDHVRHILVVVHPAGKESHVLVMHPAGPDGEPPPFFGQAAQRLDGGSTAALEGARARAVRKRNRDEEERQLDGRPQHSFYHQLEEFASPDDRAELNARRLCYGQPRFFEACAGRPFRDASLAENRALQMQDGPFAQQHRAIATCGVTHLLIMASLGLGPGPDDDVAAWEAARPAPLLGNGIAATAEYTWFTCWLHGSLEHAIKALACCQGFYENSCAQTGLQPATLAIRMLLRVCVRIVCRQTPPSSIATPQATWSRGASVVRNCAAYGRSGMAWPWHPRACRSSSLNYELIRIAQSGQPFSSISCTPAVTRPFVRGQRVGT